MFLSREAGPLHSGISDADLCSESVPIKKLAVLYCNPLTCSDTELLQNYWSLSSCTDASHKLKMGGERSSSHLSTILPQSSYWTCLTKRFPSSICLSLGLCFCPVYLLAAVLCLCVSLIVSSCICFLWCSAFGNNDFDLHWKCAGLGPGAGNKKFRLVFLLYFRSFTSFPIHYSQWFSISTIHILGYWQYLLCRLNLRCFGQTLSLRSSHQNKTKVLHKHLSGSERFLNLNERLHSKRNTLTMQILLTTDVI